MSNKIQRRILNKRIEWMTYIGLSVVGQFEIPDQERFEPQLVPRLMRDRKIVHIDRSHIAILCASLCFYVTMWFKFSN